LIFQVKVTNEHYDNDSQNILHYTEKTTHQFLFPVRL